MRRALLALAALCLAAAVPGAGAWAHGERMTTFPAKGQVFPPGVQPPVVRLRFTEPPTKDSTFFVRDGCGRNVIEDRSGQDLNVVLRLGEGQPGRWFVSYNVVSATDGHPTNGGYDFIVRGQPDCSGPDTPAPGPVAGSGGDEEPASFPVVPVLVGVGVVAGAVVVRLLSSR